MDTKETKEQELKQEETAAAEQPKEEKEAEPSLEEQLQKLEEENKQLQDRILRQMAEFDNYRKRTSKEKEELTGFVKASCAEPIITLMDNFERALKNECSDEAYKTGIEMLYQQFCAALTKLGIEEIEAEGKPFDPAFHHAVSQIQDENLGENVVSTVYQKGYKLGDHVVRHAMVVVANP